MSKRAPKILDYFVLIHSPGHARAVGDGYVPEHILVAEKVLDRLLSPDEEVRHLNGNPHDNRPANLEITSQLSDYKTQTLEDDDSERSGRKSSKTFMPCRYQRPCWKTVRAPLIKQHAEAGQPIYLPYLCSFQSGGDVYKCSRFWKFMEKEMEEKKEGV